MYGQLTRRGSNWGLPITGAINRSRAFTDFKGVQRPANWLIHASDAEMKKIGWCRLEIPRVPTGKDVESFTDEWVGGAVVRTHVLKDTPPPAPIVTGVQEGDHIGPRAAAYPPLNDMIVALWETVVEQRTAEDSGVAEIEAMRQAVKAQYPKYVEPAPAPEAEPEAEPEPQP